MLISTTNINSQKFENKKDKADIDQHRQRLFKISLTCKLCFRFNLNEMIA